MVLALMHPRASDEALARRLARIQTLADMRAGDVPRPLFRCRRCGHWLTHSPDAAAALLCEAWPICCGEEMDIPRRPGIEGRPAQGLRCAPLLGA